MAIKNKWESKKRRTEERDRKKNQQDVGRKMGNTDQTLNEVMPDGKDGRKKEQRIGKKLC